MAFQKGISGNSKGRPKNPYSMSTLIRDALEEQNESGIEYKIVIARKLRDLASNGDLKAIKEIMNRVDGLPRQEQDEKSNEIRVLISDYQISKRLPQKINK